MGPIFESLHKLEREELHAEHLDDKKRASRIKSLEIPNPLRSASQNQILREPPPHNLRVRATKVHSLSLENFADDPSITMSTWTAPEVNKTSFFRQLKEKWKEARLFSLEHQEIKLSCTCLLSGLLDENMKPLKNSDSFAHKTAKEIWHGFLKPYLSMQNPNRHPPLPANCPSQMKGLISQAKSYQKLFGDGIDWEAKKVEIMRNMARNQLFRGILQFESLTINGKNVDIDLAESDKLAWDETKSHKRDDSPLAIPQFYARIFESLSIEGFPFENHWALGLENLLKQEPAKKDRNIYKSVQLMNMSMWGVCHMELRMNTIPAVFLFPYKTKHLQQSNCNATACEITISSQEVWVTQKKKFQTTLMDTEKPIANFTIEHAAPLPKGGALFRANIKIADFSWGEDVSFEERQTFLLALFSVADDVEQQPLFPSADLSSNTFSMASAR